MLEITEVCILLFVNALLLLNGLAGLLMTSVGLDSRAHTVWDEPLFPAGSGSATYEALRNYQESMSWHGKLTSGVLSIQLCCSIALIVLSILALYGILKLKHRPLYIASYTLAVIIILTFGEAIIWIVGIFSKVVPTQNELTDTRASAGSFTGYYSNATLRTQGGVAAVDGFQAGHACCGWEGFRDWQTVLPSGDVPSSCCNQGQNCTSLNFTSTANIYAYGCRQGALARTHQVLQMDVPSSFALLILSICYLAFFFINYSYAKKLKGASDGIRDFKVNFKPDSPSKKESGGKGEVKVDIPDGRTSRENNRGDTKPEDLHTATQRPLVAESPEHEAGEPQHDRNKNEREKEGNKEGAKSPSSAPKDSEEGWATINLEDDEETDC